MVAAHDEGMTSPRAASSKYRGIQRVLPSDTWRGIGSAWRPEVLLDLLVMLALGDGGWDEAPRLARRIVSASDLRQIELIRLSPDGAVRRCSSGHLRGDLVSWVIDCIWGSPGVASELGQGRTVAWIQDDVDPPRATVCVPVLPGDEDQVVVACSLESRTGESLEQVSSRLTLLTPLLSGSRDEVTATDAAHDGPPEPGAPLSPRQRMILVAMAEGMTNRQIAARIAFSESTVRLESMAIYRHFGVHSRLDAVAAARRTGELPSAGMAVGA